MRFVLLIRTKSPTLNFGLTFLELDLPYKFSDTCGSFLRVTDTGAHLSAGSDKNHAK